MALTRKMLSAMGIEEDKQDEIINAHTETVNALKEERDSYKSDAQKLKSIQTEFETLKESMKNDDKSPYKVKYEAKVEELENLQKEFDDYKTDVSNKETLANKKNMYRQLLKDSGVVDKRIDSILKVTNFDSFELDKDGGLKNKNDLVENIKSEWADFIGNVSEQGAKTPNPPTNNGGSTMTKADIMKIKDTSERQKAWAEFLANEEGD